MAPQIVLLRARLEMNTSLTPQTSDRHPDGLVFHPRSRVFSLVCLLYPVREGRLRIAIVADHVAPTPVDVASAEAVEAVISNIRFSAQTEQDRLEMFLLATEVGDNPPVRRPIEHGQRHQFQPIKRTRRSAALSVDVSMLANEGAKP